VTEYWNANKTNKITMNVDKITHRTAAEDNSPVIFSIDISFAGDEQFAQFSI
jgi:hypothetical protein